METSVRVENPRFGDRLAKPKRGTHPKGATINSVVFIASLFLHQHISADQLAIQNNHTTIIHSESYDKLHLEHTVFYSLFDRHRSRGILPSLNRAIVARN